MKHIMTLNDKEYTISVNLYDKIKNLKQKNVTEVLLNGKMYKLSDIDIKIAVLDEELDFSTLYDNQDDELNISNPKKTQEIKEDIRTMIKGFKNRDDSGFVKPKIRDEQHSRAVADVWEHLKSTLNAIKCPVIDSNWKVDRSITSHENGRESHSVIYYIKTIDLGDNYDKYFWCEAAYIKCDACSKVIKHEIRLGNDYECEVIVRNLIRKEV